MQRIKCVVQDIPPKTIDRNRKYEHERAQDSTRSKRTQTRHINRINTYKSITKSLSYARNETQSIQERQPEPNSIRTNKQTVTRYGVNR